MDALVVEPGHWLHASPVQHASRQHSEILGDNIADAQEHPSYGNWADGIIKQYRRLLSSGITGLNFLGFQAHKEGQLWKIWNGLHVPQEQLPPKGLSSAHNLHVFCAMGS